MYMKKTKIIFFMLLIVILSATAVSAEDNTTFVQNTNDETTLENTQTPQQLETDDAPDSDEILSAGNSNAPSLDLNFPEEIPKYQPINDHYYISTNKDRYWIGSYHIDNEPDVIVNDYSQEIAPWTYSLGTHTIHANVYNVDNTTERYDLTKTFKVVPVCIIIPEKTMTGKVNVFVNIAKGATGTVYLYVDGTRDKTYKLTGKEEEYGKYFSTSTLNPGSHKIGVIYSGDGKYPKTSKTRMVDVKYDYDLFLNGDISSIEYGQTPTVSLGHVQDFKVLPIAFIGDQKCKVVRKVASDGYVYYEITVPKLPIGTYIFNLTYPGDIRYPQKSLISTVNVIPKIKTNVENELPYDRTAISLLLPENAEGNLTVIIDGNPYATTPLVNGSAIIKFNNLTIGKHTLHAEYTGTDYNVSSIDRWFTTYAKVTMPYKVQFNSKEMGYFEMNNNLNITVKCMTMDPDCRACHTFYFKVVNGKGNFSLYPITETISLHTFDFIYKVNGTEIWQSHILYVNPIPSKLVGGKNIVMYYGDTKYYSVRVWGDYGKVVGANQIVTIKIGNKAYNVRTDSNGIAKIKIPNTPGTYRILASYHGTTVTNTLSVKQVLNLKNVVVKKSAKNAILSATLKKGKTPIKSKYVTFKFNGKVYKAKTNNLGVAKVVIPKTILSKLVLGRTIAYQATYLQTTIKKTTKVLK